MAEVFCIVNHARKLSTPTRKVQMAEPLAYSNTLAHSFRFTAFTDEDEEADLTGAGIVGNFLQADGNTITPITGTASGNVAEVILPGSCYLVPGRFKFTMDITEGSTTRTAMWIEGIVEKNISGTIIDPGTPEGNISQAIGRANDAANDANSAAERAEEAADAAEGFASAIAPTFEEVMADNPFTPISANTQHVWHNGQIYVNIVDINSAEAWAGDHWAATDVSGELAKCYHESDAATTAETLSYLNL